MIRFLMRDMGVEIEPFLNDTPQVLTQSPNAIELREKWSDTAVYEMAKGHCALNGKKMRLTGEPFNAIYKFVCE